MAMAEVRTVRTDIFYFRNISERTRKNYTDGSYAIRGLKYISVGVYWYNPMNKHRAIYNNAEYADLEVTISYTEGADAEVERAFAVKFLNGIEAEGVANEFSTNDEEVPF